jgi:hypothetical protein
MIKTIYEYDNRYFDDESDVSEYIANKIGGNYNNIDPESTAEFQSEWEEVECKDLEWKSRGQNGEVYEVIEPILNDIRIIAHTTLNKVELNRLIKFLQIAVNRIDEKGFYGNQ